MSRPRPNGKQLGFVLLILALIASACSSSDDSASTADAGSAEVAESGFEPSTTIAAEEFDAAAEAEDAMSDADVEGGDKALGSGGVGSVDQQPSQAPSDFGRDIIRTAEIQVEVENVAEASRLAMTRIESLGGVLFGQETTSSGTPRTLLIFKVQPEDFSRALEQLSDVGSLRDQRVTADDVTERVVALESRITTAQTSVDRLRGFLENATDLQTIAELENQLLQRETDLELLRGQLRTLENQVSLSTITLVLTQTVPGPALEIEATAYAGHDSGTTCDGDEMLEVDEATPVTLCFAIENTGDTHLIELDVRDDAFGLDMDDLTVVRGDLNVPLAPGEELVLVAEIEADGRVASRAQATAVPADAEGQDLRLARVTARDEFVLQVIPDNSVPGFTEGLEVGWNALLALLGVIVLLAGVALPWLWVGVLIWLAVRWTRRRAANRPDVAIVPPPPPVVPAAGPDQAGPDQAEAVSAE